MAISRTGQPKGRRAKKPTRTLVEISGDEFFHDLFGGLDQENYLTMFTKPGSKATSFRVQDTDLLLAEARRQAESRDVYFRMTPTRYPPPKGKIGKAIMASALLGLHLDVDLRGPGHTKKKLPRTRRQVLEFLLLFPYFPTLVVNSGGGFHLYWVFREPWLLESAYERRKAMAVVRDFQKTYLAVAMTRYGWNLDKTWPLSQVLRVPDSWNRKGNPIKVQAYRDKHAQKFSPSDFDLILPPESKDVERPRAKPISKKQTRPKSAEAQLLHHALTEPDVLPEPAPSIPQTAPEQPKARVEKILAACAWFANARDHAADLGYDEWLAVGSITVRCTDGERWFHELSSPHPKYSFAETEKKIRDIQKKLNPRTCKWIRENGGEEFCSRCAYWADRQAPTIKSPIVAGLPSHRPRRG